jgi:hypothetical protein
MRPPERVARAALVALGLAAALAAPSRARAGDASAERFADFLSVEANEGGSSGGHLALRLGAVVYHWQSEDDGLLHISRRNAADFLYEYAVLENRTVHRSRVAVPAATFVRLRDAFQRRWLDESVAADELAARRADRELIEELVAARRDPARPTATGSPATVSVPAAGLFSAATDDLSPGETSDAVALLRARVLREHGADFLGARTTALRAELAARMPEWIERATVAPPPGPDDEWAPQGGLANEVVDRVAGEMALAVLAAARAPRAEMLRAPSDASGHLGARERCALASWADRLEGDLALLAASDRPGWGAALLLGMARLAALRQSIDSGRLVVLDAYPERPTRVSGPRLKRYRALLPGVLAEARDELAVERKRFSAATDLRESDWTEVETAANRAIELERVVAGGEDLRVAPSPMTPHRSARIAVPTPPLAIATLDRALASAKRREEEWHREIERRFEYRLLTRNCVTRSSASGAASRTQRRPREERRSRPIATADGTRKSSRLRGRAEDPPTPRCSAGSAGGARSRLPQPFPRSGGGARALAGRGRARDPLPGGASSQRRSARTASSGAPRGGPLHVPPRGERARGSLFLFYADDLLLLRPALAPPTSQPASGDGGRHRSPCGGTPSSRGSAASVQPPRLDSSRFGRGPTSGYRPPSDRPRSTTTTLRPAPPLARTTIRRSREARPTAREATPGWSSPPVPRIVRGLRGVARDSSRGLRREQR